MTRLLHELTKTPQGWRKHTKHTIESFYSNGPPCYRCGSNKCIIYMDTKKVDLSYKVCEKGHRETIRILKAKQLIKQQRFISLNHNIKLPPLTKA